MKMRDGIIMQHISGSITKREIQRLRCVELFEDFTPEGIEQIVRCSGGFFKDYKKGQIIFQEEEKPEYLYTLIKGKLLLTKTYFSGRRIVISEIHDNETFGLLIRHKEDEAYWYNAVPLTDCQVFAIPWTFFFSFCSASCAYHQQVLKNLVTVHSDSCVYQMKKSHVLSGITLDAKIAYLMFELADKDGALDFKMNREELADYLGTTRPSLSRSLMKLQKEGYIEVQRSKVKILDYDGLEEICQR